MPKLWDETVESHRRVVRETVEDAAWSLVTEHGLRAVTMAKVAAAAGLSRATIYKYFADVESILAAWHQRQVDVHVAQLTALSEVADEPGRVLRSVLGAYAEILAQRGQHGPELGALLHRAGEHRNSEELVDELLRRVLTSAVDSGQVRADVGVNVLVSYCRHALGGAVELLSTEGVDCLVELTLAGLRPDSSRQEPCEAR
ncbi:TetR/AcrR family transcriptional regulator [Actinomycetospora chibensis]|uniref:TetR/AcrR family transcriptional regulator n=1 Tax=Actinomycetospora chibensis TaxID=663606 RepID=A0ABV9RME8_9PSEU|nr:TetR/AcrR family transcriptional regulator [Actinomycetospora chibensis]MDD7922775.1 TetR/AcrR family transcriptional regulator [Actinomycetospora chibensis]